MTETSTKRAAAEYAAALRILTVDLRLQVYAERGRRGLSQREAALEAGTNRRDFTRFEMAVVANPTVATIERFVDWLTFSMAVPR